MTEFVHLAVIDKFLQGFVDFMGRTFEDFEARHRVLVVGTDPRYPLRPAANIEILRGKTRHLALWRAMRDGKKIFLHGLFDRAVTHVLLAQPQLLERCYWLIWGGELYDPEPLDRGVLGPIHKWSREFVIRNVPHLVTHIAGDVDFARNKHGARGVFRPCLLYPSNVYTGDGPRGTSEGPLRVLVGNSATDTNQHFAVLEQLAASSHAEDFSVFAPLSYGDADYARRVERRGRELLGERFIPLTKFMSREDYLALLDSIDIAVFNHSRQQAAGNIVHLLGAGKKVYLRPEISTWQTVSSLGIVVYDARNVELKRIDARVAESNARRVRDHYSMSGLESQWRALLVGDSPNTSAH